MSVVSERIKLRVFISSVQKEMASERLALQILLTTDPFLQRHTVPVLFERQIHSLRPNPQEYLAVLDGCQIYLLVLGKTYGDLNGELSATHHEFRKAKDMRLPMLVCIFGDNKVVREAAVDEFFAEIKSDSHTYTRFHSTKELQELVRDRLVKHIDENYHLEPTHEETAQGNTSIQVASLFERQRTDAGWAEASNDLTVQLSTAADEVPAGSYSEEDILRSLRNRGYLWHDVDHDLIFLTGAGLLVFGNDPTTKFAHCRVQADAFAGTIRDGAASDHATIRGPIPRIIDETVAFIHRNIRHPLRVVGLKRVNFAEYPEEAIREALVNALAHRDYEDASRHIVVEVFRDRLVFSSPGGPPGEQDVADIARGHSRSRSRNPLISQGLRFLSRMEERGTGILRMKSAMLDHGLDKPKLKIVDEYFVVTLPGAGDDLDRLRVPDSLGSGVSPSVEDQLSDREKAILKQAVETGKVTTDWCVSSFGIVKDTARRDFNHLVELGLLEKTGKGRSTAYLPTDPTGR